MLSCCGLQYVVSIPFNFTWSKKMTFLSTPILFLKEFKNIPNAILRLLGLPSVSYSDSEVYSLNKIVTFTFGLNIFQVTGIIGLTFLASIVLVTILLPNIYFRVMLLTDQSVQQRRRLDKINEILSMIEKQNKR